MIHSFKHNGKEPAKWKDLFHPAYIVSLLFFVGYFMFGAVMTSCEYDKMRQKAEDRHKESVYKDKCKWIYDELYEVEFKGHTYIIYSDKDGYGFAGGITHAAHCPCMNKK